MKLTTSSHRTLSLPPGATDKAFFDDELPGFGLRLRASGEHRWIVQYDIGAKTRRVTLGSPTLLKLDAARKRAKDILAAVRLGSDPASEKREARERAAETFGVLLRTRYLPHKEGQVRPRSLIEIKRHLLSYARPLHARPVASINRRAIAGLIAKLASENGPTAANCALASLSGFFTWLLREGLIDGANPAAYVNKANARGPRERVLTPDELRLIDGALGDDDYADIVRLLMYLPVRKTEIGDLRWDELDLTAAEIRLPESRTKGGRAVIIPLTAVPLGILQRRQNNGRPYVFGHGHTGFRNWSRGKRRLDARLGQAVRGWVLHDLRRTFSTVAHETLGIAPHIVEVLLSHIGHQAGVRGTYNKAQYLRERRQALEMWAGYIDAALSGSKSKVVNLRRG